MTELFYAPIRQPAVCTPRRTNSQFEAEPEMPWTRMPQCTTFVLLSLLALLGGCAAPTPYAYRFVPAKTATLRDGHAIAPSGAPDKVRAAIDAANRIAGLPYARGGGHGRGMSRSYDCSGATSYVLHAAGLLESAMPSKGFRNYGERGQGKWITIYARRDHVFLIVAGLRFDTG
jgi:cell wall-associated NlpC family hydrolase